MYAFTLNLIVILKFFSILTLCILFREIIPGVALTSDFIVGFCGETEQEFDQTVDLIKTVKYTKLFIFPYSLR